MQMRLDAAFFVLIVGGALTAFLPISSMVSAQQTSDTIRIDGLVNRNLTLSRAELLSFPMVSEVARLKCVMNIPDVTYNWTGIPLFHLLTLAQIKPEAYKIVTRGSGGFESDLLVEEGNLRE
jgi:DMSO/TMAO reductase YedYZ molybdopterin-dependent catalytic subunit